MNVPRFRPLAHVANRGDDIGRRTSGPVEDLASWRDCVRCCVPAWNGSEPAIHLASAGEGRLRGEAMPAFVPVEITSCRLRRRRALRSRHLRLLRAQGPE